jgi:hypothetical protein
LQCAIYSTRGEDNKKEKKKKYVSVFHVFL